MYTYKSINIFNSTFIVNNVKKDFLILLPRTNVMTILFQLQSRDISTDANLRYVAMFMHAYLLYTATGNKTKKVKIWCAEQNSIRHFAKCYYCKHVKQMWELFSTQLMFDFMWVIIDFLYHSCHIYE